MIEESQVEILEQMDQAGADGIFIFAEPDPDGEVGDNGILYSASVNEDPDW